MQDEAYEDEIKFDDPPIVEEIPSDELDNVAVAGAALYRTYTSVYSGIPLKTSNVTVYLIHHFYI